MLKTIHTMKIGAITNLSLKTPLLHGPAKKSSTHLFNVLIFIELLCLSVSGLSLCEGVVSSLGEAGFLLLKHLHDQELRYLE